MDSTRFLQMLGVSALSGALCHLMYFFRGEHHMQAPLLFSMAVGMPVVLATSLGLRHPPMIDAWIIISVSSAAFMAGLITSMVLYRCVFHPLRGFPGPPLARVSKLYHAYQCLRNNNYEILAKWHSQYGDTVRIGPNELSLLSPGATDTLYGVRSPCYKAPWYDMGDPTESLHTVRSREKHDERRRLWNQCLSPKALYDFEEYEVSYVQLLKDQIKERTGEPLNVTNWFNFFSFDVAAEFAFGEPFGMLASGEPHSVMKTMHSGQRYLAALSPVPWLARILLQLPSSMSGALTFKKWCAEQIQRRRQASVKRKDLMSVLLADAEKQSNSMEAKRWLTGDCRLVIVGGSDTTATALVHIFYYLARYPEKAQRLRDALEGCAPSSQQLRQKHIRGIEYLNAFINEALRLHPPVPSGLLRVTPPEGLTCGKTFIPGGVSVSVPMQPLGRLESLYVRPNEFIPESWLSNYQLIHDKHAFNPFSVGPYACVGKNLAMMEMQTVTAVLVQHFDISFAPGEDGDRLLNGSLDAFTLFPGDLYLVFKTRGADRELDHT